MCCWRRSSTATIPAGVLTVMHVPSGVSLSRNFLAAPSSVSPPSSINSLALMRFTLPSKLEAAVPRRKDLVARSRRHHDHRRRIALRDEPLGIRPIPRAIAALLIPEITMLGEIVHQLGGRRERRGHRSALGDGFPDLEPNRFLVLPWPVIGAIGRPSIPFPIFQVLAFLRTIAVALSGFPFGELSFPIRSHLVESFVKHRLEPAIVLTFLLRMIPIRRHLAYFASHRISPFPKVALSGR